MGEHNLPGGEDLSWYLKNNLGFRGSVLGFQMEERSWSNSLNKLVRSLDWLEIRDDVRR